MAEAAKHQRVSDYIPSIFIPIAQRTYIYYSLRLECCHSQALDLDVQEDLLGICNKNKQQLVWRDCCISQCNIVCVHELLNSLLFTIIVIYALNIGCAKCCPFEDVRWCGDFLTSIQWYEERNKQASRLPISKITWWPWCT